MRRSRYADKRDDDDGDTIASLPLFSPSAREEFHRDRTRPAHQDILTNIEIRECTPYQQHPSDPTNSTTALSCVHEDEEEYASQQASCSTISFEDAVKSVSAVFNSFLVSKKDPKSCTTQNEKGNAGSFTALSPIDEGSEHAKEINSKSGKLYKTQQSPYGENAFKQLHVKTNLIYNPSIEVQTITSPHEQCGCSFDDETTVDLEHEVPDTFPRAGSKALLIDRNKYPSSCKEPHIQMTIDTQNQSTLITRVRVGVMGKDTFDKPMPLCVIKTKKNRKVDLEAIAE